MIHYQTYTHTHTQKNLPTLFHLYFHSEKFERVEKIRKISVSIVHPTRRHCRIIVNDERQYLAFVAIAVCAFLNAKGMVTIKYWFKFQIVTNIQWSPPFSPSMHVRRSQQAFFKFSAFQWSHSIATRSHCVLIAYILQCQFTLSV